MEVESKLELKNKGVKLRIFRRNDVHIKVEWINNPLNNKYLHYNIPLNDIDTEKWYDNKNNTNRLDLIIEYNDCPAGVIGLLNIDRVNMKAEYYITIGEENCKNKGVATIATNLLFQYAFEVLELNKIYLNVDAENILACKLYEKVGMKKSGYFVEDLNARGKLIDRVRYEIRVNEYKEMVKQA